MIIAISSGHNKIIIPKLVVLHIISTIHINRIYSDIIAIMLFNQGAIMNHFINFFFQHFITIFRFTIFKQNFIEIIKCTQLTSNWFIIIGSFEKISKWMRIHINRFLASEDASK